MQFTKGARGWHTMWLDLETHFLAPYPNWKMELVPSPQVDRPAAVRGCCKTSRLELGPYLAFEYRSGPASSIPRLRRGSFIYTCHRTRKARTQKARVIQISSGTPGVAERGTCNALATPPETLTRCALTASLRMPQGETNVSTTRLQSLRGDPCKC